MSPATFVAPDVIVLTARKAALEQRLHDPHCQDRHKVQQELDAVKLTLATCYRERVRREQAARSY